MSEPTCKVRGMIQPGAMCSKIIVGGKYCGFTGDCPHKSCAKEMANTTQAATPADSQIADSDEFSNCEFCSYCVTINDDAETFCYFKCAVVHKVCEQFKHFEGKEKP